MLNSQEIRKNWAIESFRYSLWQARKDALLSKIWRDIPNLKNFGEVPVDLSKQRRSLGTREIPVDKITGTVGRQDDFDGRFRPLKNHLRDRWINIALSFQDAGWPPIDVFKVGEEYFVLDGHHRTSYARNLGMAFMEANVWEVVPESPAASVPTTNAAKKLSAKPEPVKGIVIYDSIECCCLA
ncbi:MAG: hypothetical protein KDE48_20775 [Anaerolineales bacterium]|nr:hypothetical protein [Anaerolineales bacterium]